MNAEEKALYSGVENYVVAAVSELLGMGRDSPRVRRAASRAASAALEEYRSCQICILLEAALPDTTLAGGGRELIQVRSDQMHEVYELAARAIAREEGRAL